MDQQFRSLERSIPHRSSTYPWSDRALSTSKWSPQHASSSPSKPHSPHFLASSSSGRSAHCPVKSVTGLATCDSSSSPYHANSRYSLAPPLPEARPHPPYPRSRGTLHNQARRQGSSHYRRR